MTRNRNDQELAGSTKALNFALSLITAVVCVVLLGMIS